MMCASSTGVCYFSSKIVMVKPEYFYFFYKYYIAYINETMCLCFSIYGIAIKQKQV